MRREFGLQVLGHLEALQKEGERGGREKRSAMGPGSKRRGMEEVRKKEEGGGRVKTSPSGPAQERRISPGIQHYSKTHVCSHKPFSRSSVT